MYLLEDLENDIIDTLRNSGKVRTSKLIDLVNTYRQHKRESIKWKKKKASVGAIMKTLKSLQTEGKIKKTVSSDSQAVFYELSKNYESLIVTDLLKELIERPRQAMYKQIVERIEDSQLDTNIMKAALKNVSFEQLVNTIAMLRWCLGYLERGAKYCKN